MTRYFAATGSRTLLKMQSCGACSAPISFERLYKIGLSIPGLAVVEAAPDDLLLDTLYCNAITLDLARPGGGMAFLDDIKACPHVPVMVLSSGTTEGMEATSAAIAGEAAACFSRIRGSTLPCPA